MEPPPAPISIMSMTGALIGSPLPRLKRWTRAASIPGATSGAPSWMRQALAVVPPMSNDSTSRSPVSRPTKALASPPPAGPDSSRRTGKAIAISRRRHAAGGLHQVEPAPGGVRRLQRGREPRQVARDEGLDVGVGGRRARPVVLPDLGDDLVGERDEELRELPPDQLGHRPLVGRVPVGVEEADGQRLDAAVHQPGHLAAHLGQVDGHDHRPVAGHPLVRLAAELPRHQRLGEAEEEVVDVVPLLGAGFKNVPEAARRQEADPRALAPDDGVGDERGAVDQEPHLGAVHAGRPQQLLEPGQDAEGRVLRRGEALVDPHRARPRVEQDEVREGAADVEADVVAGWHGAQHTRPGPRLSTAARADAPSLYLSSVR